MYLVDGGVVLTVIVLRMVKEYVLFGMDRIGM